MAGEAKTQGAAPRPSQPGGSKLNNTFSSFKPENLASKAGAFPKPDIHAATNFAGARMRSFESEIRQKMGAQAGAQTARNGTARGAGSARAQGPAAAPNRFTALTGWSAPDGRGVHWRTVRDNATGLHQDEFFNPRTGMSGKATPWSAPDASGIRTRSLQDKTGKQWAEHFNPKTGRVSFTFPWSPPGPTGDVSRATIRENGETWNEVMNSRTGKHLCSSPFVLRNGVQQRQVYDCKARQMWHESIDVRTGAHTSVTAWSRPDPFGACTRTMYDHKTGQSHTQVFRPHAHGGNTGHTGNAGNAGNAGNTGHTGNTGNTGHTGNTGNTGGASGASGTGQASAEARKKKEIDDAVRDIGLDPAKNPSPAEIRTAYRKAMLKWHPDRNKSDPPDVVAENSRKINNARDQLVKLGILDN